MSSRLSTPVSQFEIEEELIRLLGLLEDETDTFGVLSMDAAKKEAKHKSAWAKAYIAGTGSIKDREAWATYQTEESQMDWQIADALGRSKREKLSSLRTSIDALRTLNANTRILAGG